MDNNKAFTGLYGYYEEENRIIYHNSPYKIFFLLYKDDFNKAVEECLKFAKGFLNSKIDRVSTK